MRNDDRHPLNWDQTSPLRTIEDVSIILAVQELEGELAEQATANTGSRGSNGQNSISQREEGDGQNKEIDEDELEELTERVSRHR